MTFVRRAELRVRVGGKACGSKYGRLSGIKGKRTRLLAVIVTGITTCLQRGRCCVSGSDVTRVDMERTVSARRHVSLTEVNITGF